MRTQNVLCLSKLSKLSCESCRLGKHNRGPFRKSLSNKVLSSSILAYFDIWRRTRVKSTLGFQYFATFIDYS